MEPSGRFQHLKPPAWYLALTGRQRTAWNELCTKQISGADVGGIEKAVTYFLATAPPSHARAAAEFLRLQTSLTLVSPSAAFQQWLRFAEKCGGILHPDGVYEPATNGWQGVESEAGLPLSTLATIEAIRTTTARQFNPRITPDQWRAVVREVWFNPCPLTGLLLDCTEARAHGVEPFATDIEKLRQRLNFVQSRWELADAIRLRQDFADATGSFWIQDAGQWWLCMLQPAETNETTLLSATKWEVGTPAVEAFLYSQVAIANAFSNALQSIRNERPARYLTLSVEVEGKPISIPAP